MAFKIIMAAMGVLTAAASFFMEKYARMHEQAKEETKDLQTVMDKSEVDKMEERIKELYEKTEGELSKISCKKMNELTEYAEQILNKISLNHKEVIFLYDMLNEKDKDVKNSIGKLDDAKYEINKLLFDINEEKMSTIEFLEGEAGIRKGIQVSDVLVSNPLTGDDTGVKETKSNEKKVTKSKTRNVSQSKPNQAQELLREEISNRMKKMKDEDTANIVEKIIAENTIEDATAKEESDAIILEGKNVKTAPAKRKKTTTSAKTSAGSKTTTSAKTSAGSKTTTSAKTSAGSKTTTSAKTSAGSKKTTTKRKKTEKTTDESKKIETLENTKESYELETSSLKEDDSEEVTEKKYSIENEKILELYSKGLSYLDISKKLNLGLGEVMLVVNLYKNNVYVK